ncbi:MAG: histidine triad nucleotide-binding protein [Selenomonadaceae bacterium]|nr:histidine triad nucleotide-binding protein [Selenomonadaceae bacterium]
MSDCIFCRIAKQEIPATVVYEDESVIAFKDLSPQAPVHILIIPKKHVASLMEVRAEDSQTLAHIMGEVVPKLANEQQLSAGFRVVINTGEEGGQTVNHLHFHLLGGRSMQWPPG